MVLRSLRRNFRTEKSLTAKCPYGEVSLRRNVFTAKCPYGEVSVRRRVRTANCPTAKCRTAKSVTAKSPGAICIYLNAYLYLQMHFTAHNSYIFLQAVGAVYCET